MNSAAFSLTGKVLFGGKSFGVGVKSTRFNEVFIGPYSKPWFTFRFKPQAWKKDQGKTEPKTWMTRIKKQSPLLKSAKAGLGAIKWDHFSLRGIVGFQNPMTTGITFGLLHGLQSIIPDERITIAITPRFPTTFREFPGSHTDLSASLGIKFQPGVFIWKATLAYLNFKP
ncbi:MAG: hypothetical protein GXO92_06470 [FCB group bacterium]|nr:hypothetical protein [FCB group bacterium]